MAQQSIEERVAFLESKIAEYEAERAQMRELVGMSADVKEEQEKKQEEHDIAQLARIDSMNEDVRRIERTQIRGFEDMRTSQKELRDDLRLRIHAGNMELRDEIATQADALRTEYHAGYTYLGGRIGGVEKAVEQLQVGQQEHTVAIKQLQVGQQEHTAAIENLAGEVRGLAAGQQQILDLLTGGKPKRND